MKMNITRIGVVAAAIVWAGAVSSQGVPVVSDIEGLGAGDLREELGLSAGGELEDRLAELFLLYTECSPVRASLIYVDSSGYQNEVSLSAAQSALQEAIESRLSQAGIYSDNDDTPFLLLTVNIWEGLVDIDIRFHKYLFDAYTEEYRTAITWTDGVFGPHDSSLVFIHDNATGLLDGFLVEYLRVNESAC